MASAFLRRRERSGARTRSTRDGWPHDAAGSMNRMRPSARLAPLLAAALVTACGNDASSRWVELARGFRPSQPMLERARAWHAAAGLDPEEVRPSQEAVNVEHALEATEWREDEPGLWSAALPGGVFPFGL